MLKRFLHGSGRHNESPASNFSVTCEAPPSSRVATPSYLYSQTSSHEPGNGFFDNSLNISNVGPSRAGTPFTSRTTSPVPPPSADGLPSPNEEHSTHKPNIVFSRTESSARSKLLKSTKIIESLLESLSQLNDIQQKLNKCQKTIMKTCKDLANVLSEDTVSKEDIADNVLSESWSIPLLLRHNLRNQPPIEHFLFHLKVNTLMCVSFFFGSLHEVTTKAAKITEKEYKNVEELVKKAFKRLAKEERMHDEHIEAIEAKIQKSNDALDKNRKPSKRGINLSSGDFQVETLAAEQYGASLSSLALDVTNSKAAHSIMMHYLRESLCRMLCTSVFQIAENEWRRSCEEVRKAGLMIGRLTMWANFCTHDGMPKMMPESVQSDDHIPGLHIRISPQNIPSLSAIHHAGQSNRLDDGKDNVDYHGNLLGTEIKTPSAASSPAMFQSTEKLCSPVSYETTGLGLAQSPSKTLGSTNRPLSPLTLSLETSAMTSVKEATPSNALSPRHQGEVLSVPERQNSPWLRVSDGVEPNSKTAIATAPLTVRKFARQSQEETTHRQEESNIGSAGADLPAYHDGVSSQLLRMLNSQDAQFDIVHPMSSEQLATIKAHNRVVESHNATVELTRLLEAKIGDISELHQSSSADQPHSRAVTPLVEMSNDYRMVENRFRSADGVPIQERLRARSKRDEQKEIELSADQSVVSPNDNVPHVPWPLKTEDPAALPERQNSTASDDSAKTSKTNMKEVFLPLQSRPTVENTASPRFPPKFSNKFSADHFPAQGNNVAAIASRFSALTDPYMRQFEPRKFTEAESSARRVASPPLLQRSRPHAHHRLSAGVANPLIKPNRHLSTGYLPLLPNRNLPQTADDQQFRINSQQMKSCANTQGTQEDNSRRGG